MKGLYTASEILAMSERHEPPPPTRDTNPAGKRLTYAELEQREPRLAELRRFVSAQHPGGEGYCANRAWFREPGFKSGDVPHRRR